MTSVAITPSATGLEEILSSFDGADIVSFDVFDTLLARPLLRPTDVFTLVRDKVNASGETALLANWPEQRVHAEHLCYQSRAMGPNVTLEQIYGMLESAFGYPPPVAADAMKAECEIEIDLLRATSRGKTLYDAARSLGKSIYLVSDMYLPASVLETALRREGFSGWDRLIISGYEKLAKHDGSIFRRLRQEHSHAHLVHVGDNPISDVRQPRQHGIEAFELERPFVARERAGSSSALPLSKLERIAAAGNINAKTVSLSLVGGLSELWMEHQPSQVDPLDEIGYCIVGPMYAGFVQYVHERARRDGMQALAFLARDGHVMKRAYEAYFGANALPSSYVYASRRMMNFAVISERLTARDYDFLSATGTPIPIEAFATRVLGDLDVNTLDVALERIGVERGSIVRPSNRAPAQALLAALQPEIVRHAEVEQATVLDYLRSEGLDKATVGLVDIGWQGSIQDSMESLLGVQLHGYYLGVLDTPKTAGRRTMHGWMDSRKTPLERKWLGSLHGRGAELIELLFAHPIEPSITTIARADGVFSPVYSQDRVRDKDAVLIARIQERALDFVRDLARTSLSTAAPATPLSFEVALMFMRDLVLRPSQRQAELLGGLHHDNSLGVHSYPIGMPRRPAQFYRSHPRALVRERRKAWWKPGFDANCARLGLSEPSAVST